MRRTRQGPTIICRRFTWFTIIALLEDVRDVCPLMKTRKIASRAMETERRFDCWLRAVVNEARTLGELAYRRSLIQDELKTLELRTKTELKWIKKAESAGRTADAEHFREANKYLVQARYRSEQELEKLGRLIVAFQEDLDESINVLTGQDSTT